MSGFPLKSPSAQAWPMGIQPLRLAKQESRPLCRPLKIFTNDMFVFSYFALKNKKKSRTRVKICKNTLKKVGKKSAKVAKKKLGRL